MEIRTNDGVKICGYPDWEAYMKGHKPNSWSDGKSAQMLAKYITKEGGDERIRAILAEIFQVEMSMIDFEEGVVECKVNFDQFRHPREHDLAIKGKITINGETEDLFIGIEAKVDESFGPKVKSKLDNASPKSNLPKRIEQLADKLGIKEMGKEEEKDKINDLYYQLLYMIAGCVPFDDKHIPLNGVYVAMILNFGRGSKKAFANFIKNVSKPTEEHLDKLRNDEISSYDVKFGDEFVVKVIFVPQNMR